MPFWFGAMGSHDDSSHQGSAKRDTANGVAGLSAAGEVIAPGSKLFLSRDLAGKIWISERTANENGAYLLRNGATDYSMFIEESGADKRVQTESMKDVASGIAGLDAQMLIRGGILSAFNLLKIYSTNIFTQSLSGTGTITPSNALGNVAVNAPANNDSAIFGETDQIALSLLPRIAVFRIGAISLTGVNSIISFGLENTAGTHYARIESVDGGSTWNFVTRAGGATTSNAIAAPAANDVFVMYCTSARCSLWKNGAHVVTPVTNIPTAGIGHSVSVYAPTATGVGASLTLGFMA